MSTYIRGRPHEACGAYGVQYHSITVLRGRSIPEQTRRGLIRPLVHRFPVLTILTLPPKVVACDAGKSAFGHDREQAASRF